MSFNLIAIATYTKELEMTRNPGERQMLENQIKCLRMDEAIEQAENELDRIVPNSKANIEKRERLSDQIDEMVIERNKAYEAMYAYEEWFENQKTFK